MQSFIWFQIAQDERHPDIIYWGFWALASFGFLILFLANRYIKHTLAAQIILLITAFMVALIGPLLMYSAYFFDRDPQSGIAVVAEPCLALLVCGISVIIATILNCIFRK